MTFDDTRKVLSLQAIEQADESQAILTDADYREAASNAGAPLPKDAGTSEENQFLSLRADQLLIRTMSRFPKASTWANQPSSGRRLGLFGLFIFVVAAVAGILTNELGPEKRINILSFPLLGIMLWSFLIYLREGFLLIQRRRSPSEASHVPAFVEFLHSPVQEPPPADSVEEKTLEGARLLFQKRWRKLTTPALAARLKSILHIAALILAATAVGGMYVKGLANEYRAVWESTFFPDSSQLRPFLNLVLGPASTLTGQPLPSVEELDKIHWQAGKNEMPGENAGIWIHWYAITVALFVIIPRGLLAALWKLKALRLERSLPFRETSADYFDHLLAISTGNSVSISLIPYPVSPAEESKRQILRTLEDHFEKPVDITWMAAVPFGSEEEPILGLDGEVIPVFDFSSTPEKETHLALIETLMNQAPEPVRNVVLETSRFDQKAARLSDGRERHEERMKTWSNLFETVKVGLLPSGTNPVAYEEVT